MNRRDVLTTGAGAAALVAASPVLGQATGLAEGGTAKVTAAMQAAVDAGKVPGAVWLLSRGDDVAVGAAGTFEFDGHGAPMARGTIFRIASVGKPIGAAAVMMLVEEGRLTLEEPVDRLLPELADRKVLTSLDALRLIVGERSHDRAYRHPHDPERCLLCRQHPVRLFLECGQFRDGVEQTCAVTA